MIAALLLRFGIPKWAAILALCALAAASAIAYRHHLIQQGVSLEAARRDKIDADNTAKAEAEQGRLNALVAKAQAELGAALAHLDQLKSDLDHEQAASRTLQSDLAAGRRRLSVAIARAGQADPAQPPDSTSAGGLDSQSPATADLDPQAASRVVELTGTGDSAIIRLNACIAAYDAVKAAADALP